MVCRSDSASDCMFIGFSDVNQLTNVLAAKEEELKDALDNYRRKETELRNSVDYSAKLVIIQFRFSCFLTLATVVVWWSYGFQLLEVVPDSQTTSFPFQLPRLIAMSGSGSGTRSPGKRRLEKSARRAEDLEGWYSRWIEVRRRCHREEEGGVPDGLVSISSL